jgi:hypothetical protein
LEPSHRDRPRRPIKEKIMTAKIRMETLLAVLVTVCLAMPETVLAQRGAGPGAGRGGRGGPGGAATNLPADPVAVPLPTIAGPQTGPGTPYESVQSLPPGRDLAHYGYEALEYFVTGTAAGEPYKTRIVIRKPRNNADFSGLVLLEAMHPSGSAHLFEFTSDYSMDSGHIVVEVVAGGMQNLTGHNPARYEDFSVSGAQTTEVLAQVGALLKEGPASPLAGLGLRRMVLAGTSATAGTLIQYLPAHPVYRTPSMRPVFDGYLPHSNGSTIAPVDAPLIQVPTMTEVRQGNVTTRQDSDEPGNQYRLYEFAGMGHLDSRDNVRTRPDPCANPTSNYPLQAYLSVALDHLFRWVDTGTSPPRANRVLIDRNTDNDGSLMALDAHGNPIGGIRNPYLDVPVAKYGVPNSGAAALPENPSAYMAAAGLAGANQICGLGAYQIDMAASQLRELYGSKQEYLRQVEQRMRELEAAGWSLPVYRDTILGDARAVEF